LYFRSEFTSLERRWQIDKEKVSSQLLMADASSYFTNIVASGSLKLETNKHAQIIASTMQILELKHAMSQVKTSTKPSGDAVNPSNEAHSKNDNGVLQKLRMVTSSTWSRRMALSCGGVTSTNILIANSWECRFFHKLTEHNAWKQRKNEYNERKGKGKSNLDVKLLLVHLL
jgi:hypothetical protein